MLGFINVYKPEGVTSNFVVQKIKRKFKINKIGHMGTLDPIACGVLPIAIGKATRLFDYALDKIKTYEVIYDFGFTTDTLDTTGNITKQNDFVPNLNEIKAILNSFLGESDQIPPDFSAKNVNGRRAYDLAREGVSFELKPKKISVYDFSFLEQISKNRFKFKITCSSGTYIRAIGRDLGDKLGALACMSFLERTETGNFNALDAIDFDKLLTLDTLDNIIISPLNVFGNFDQLNISNNDYVNLKNGIKVNLGKIKNNTFVIHNSNLIGVIRPCDNAIKLDTYLEE